MAALTSIEQDPSIAHSEQHHIAGASATLITAGQTGQKRKREEEEDKTVDKRAKSFEIKLLARPADNVTTLTPQYLLPRAHLPLGWLDLTEPGTGLYAGNIHLLETTYDRGLPPSVLIASRRHTLDRYALERASQKRYVAIKLIPSLDADKLVKRAIWTAPVKPSSPVAEEQKDVAHADSRRKRRIQPEVIETIPDQLDAPSSQQLEPEEVMQELVKQYLEALYLSKTSLAYFVKGPLSRLRSLSLERDAISTFLREIILSIVTTDQRLKEHIPNAIKESEEKPTRKRKWKAKRDRQGFLSCEADHIKQWWERCDSSTTNSATPPSVASMLKNELALIRTRETFLQVIITMEVLALEWTATKVETPEDSSVRKTKKQLALDRHLEALLDRLVIWQSLEAQSSSKDVQHTSQDGLRDFCVEVIVPFFTSRIPKIVAAVNKKLGGPTTRSPLKRMSLNKRSSRVVVDDASKQRPDQSTVDKQRPGEPMMRRVSSKDQFPALNASKQLSDHPTERGAQLNAPLRRSATDTQLTMPRHVRRESSASVSVKSDTRRPGSALDSLTRREIDLSAASAASKEKLRKRTEQEARVREAVAGIRKPDRSVALQENAALVDAKFAQHLHRSRKPQTTKRSDVHIQATPRLIKTAPMQPAMSGAFLGLPSTDSIPQTGHRERLADMLTPARGRYTSESKSPLLSRTKIVENTPSRPRTLFSIVQTPVKATELASATPMAMVSMHATLPNAANSTPVVEKSIYDALGWNDDSYEELV